MNDNDNDIVIYSGNPEHPSYAEGFTRRERRRLGIKEADWVLVGTPGERYSAYRIRLQKWYLGIGTVRAECYVDELLLDILSSDEIRMDTIAGECMLHLDRARLHCTSGGARD